MSINIICVVNIRYILHIANMKENKDYGTTQKMVGRAFFPVLQAILNKADSEFQFYPEEVCALMNEYVIWLDITIEEVELAFEVLHNDASILSKNFNPDGRTSYWLGLPLKRKE